MRRTTVLFRRINAFMLPRANPAADPILPKTPFFCNSKGPKLQLSKRKYGLLSRRSSILQASAVRPADPDSRYGSSTSGSELHYSWLRTVWQHQIRRIWGWLHRFASFAIPKLRLRLPPRIEPCRIHALAPLAEHALAIAT